jgi:hypothetical protein
MDHNGTERGWQQTMDGMAQLNVRLSDRGEVRLERLCDLLGMGKTDVVERSLVHLLATLERREKADLVVPSEWAERQDSSA